MTTTLRLDRDGKTVAVVDIDGNDVSVQGLEDTQTREQILSFDGGTSYNGIDPGEENTDHIDEITPMEEKNIANQVAVIAQRDGLSVNGA